MQLWTQRFSPLNRVVPPQTAQNHRLSFLFFHDLHIPCQKTSILRRTVCIIYVYTCQCMHVIHVSFHFLLLCRSFHSCPFHQPQLQLTKSVMSCDVQELLGLTKNNLLINMLQGWHLRRSQRVPIPTSPVLPRSISRYPRRSSAVLT